PRLRPACRRTGGGEGGASRHAIAARVDLDIAPLDHLGGALRWFRHDSDTPSPHEVWHIEFRRGGVSGHVGTTAASEAASSGATAAAIRDEIDLLDRARAALARGAPDLAL